MASKIMLPFGQIQPGTFDAAFQRPKSQATGLPMGVEQLAKDPAGAPLRGTGLAPGVEQQARTKLAAKLDQGPQRPMIVNGVRSFDTAPAAAPAPMPAPAPMMAAAPRPAPMMMAPAAPALRPQAPASPFGGMNPTPLSTRGGPMSYSQQGVGTNNPNAYAVGQNRAPLGMRLLERAARRRDPRAIMALASMEQQNAQQGQQMGMMQMREEADAARFDQQQQNQMTMFERQQLAMQQRDATEFQQQQQMFQMQSEQRAGESALEYQRRLEQERAQREGDAIVGAETVLDPGGKFYIPAARTQRGDLKMAGGSTPLRPPETPLPAGLVPTGAVIGGVRYGPSQSAVDGKAPSFTYEKDPSGKITGAVYPVQDPQTGAWKLQRADINGDGVVSPEEAAAVPVAAAAASAALKTKAGNSYTFK